MNNEIYRTISFWSCLIIANVYAAGANGHALGFVGWMIMAGAILVLDTVCYFRKKAKRKNSS